MHNIKNIRKDFDNFKELLKSRNLKIDINNIKNLDEKNRILIQKKKNLKVKKKKFLNLKIKIYLINQKKYQLN